jgi:AraC-like DNA-binding protein
VTEPLIMRSDRPRLTFFYCLKGKADLEIPRPDGRKRSEKITTGMSLFFLLDGESRLSRRRLPFQAVALQPHPECLNVPLARFASPPDGCIIMKGNIPLRLRILLEHMFLCRDDGVLREVFFTHKKYELLYRQIELLGERGVEDDISAAERRAAARAWNALLEHVSDPPSLTELAAIAGVNRTRLTELFRALFGDTVFGALRRERLECARKLLEGKNKSVSDISYLCGFSSPSHLSRAFAAHFGVTPTEYQNAGKRGQGAAANNLAIR